MQMMEGPPVSASANTSSAGNSMYAIAQQSATQYGGVQQQQQKPDDPNAKSLYVGNLDPRVSEQVLVEVFAAVRPVVAVKIIPDKRQTHGGLNYGFVEFATHQDADVALQSLNGRGVFDYEIRVNWAFTSGGGSGSGSGFQMQEDTNNHFHIFVGDLSAEVNDQVLGKAFGVYPSVSDARVMWDMTSGKSRGYGFVAFRDRGDAEKAIAQMNGEWLGSRAIRVNWANQKASAGRFTRHDSSASSLNGHTGGMHGNHLHQPQALSYEAVRDQTAQYNTTVYVGNLTNYTSQEQLQGLFQPYGFVMEFRMQPDRGFAFIKLDTHENAAMAITQLNGSPVNGRPIKCSWGKDRVVADPKAAFGALAAAAAANPAYSYPYVYGMPPPQQQQQQQPQQQQQSLQQQAQQAQQPGNAQAWGSFGYENYAYYTNPSYPQHAQMMPAQQQAAAAAAAHASIPGGVANNTMPAGNGGHGASPNSNGY